MADLIKVVTKSIIVREFENGACQTSVFVDGKPSAVYPMLDRENAIKLANVLADNDDAKAFMKTTQRSVASI